MKKFRALLLTFAAIAGLVFVPAARADEAASKQSIEKARDLIFQELKPDNFQSRIPEKEVKVAHGNLSKVDRGGKSYWMGTSTEDGFSKGMYTYLFNEKGELVSPVSFVVTDRAAAIQIRNEILEKRPELGNRAKGSAP